MEKGRIAIPSEGEGGLGGTRSNHFGHCDVFTLIDVEQGQIKSVTTLPNQSHARGGCMVPVKILADNQVDALVVGGIGKGPLMGFKQVGIDIYFDATHTSIQPVVEELLADKLPVFGLAQACRGDEGHCQG